ncbi:uncharacterized protein [Euphorbia lathyris]|uniref:uncharacterized protein isoform X2 n=1 Tax=Euphorbia lathyris TaxID=212925 RepID=UPI003313D0B8
MLTNLLLQFSWLFATFLFIGLSSIAATFPLLNLMCHLTIHGFHYIIRACSVVDCNARSRKFLIAELYRGILVELVNCEEFMKMTSKTGVEIGDFPLQVSDKLELGNTGASLSELFGYSKEFEHQLYLEMQPDDFKITSLLYESENDDYFLQLMEYKNQNDNMFRHNLVPSQQSYVTVEELAPTANKIHEHNLFLSHQKHEVDKQETNHPLSPPAIQTSDDKSHLQWSYELHSGIMEAVELLGGFERATPESILRLMNVKGLTLDHVKSHLQTYQQCNYFDHESTKTSQIAGDSEKRGTDWKDWEECFMC